MASVILYLSKFKLEPPAVQLSGALKKLGMKSAFDQGSANFRRMTRSNTISADNFHIFYGCLR